MNMMMLRYIMLPVVGAVIGYATNWIAVKMLFRPLREVRVFGWKLPFTPGVIPKGQSRLAKATGKAVEEQLLTKEVLERVLLSADMKEKVYNTALDFIASQETSEQTLAGVACEVIPEEKAQKITESVQVHLTDLIFEKMKEKNVGRVVADKALEAAKEKLAESMLGVMFSGSMLDPIAGMIEKKVNEFVDENARGYIYDMVREESNKLGARTVGDTVSLVGQYDVDFPTMVLTLYEKIVAEQLPAALAALNLSGIVEDRINAMDVEEVEALLLSIMKKELGAIVNLGALIGFVLGLCNLAILLI